jgi:putative ABC transport system permease protein
VLRLAARNVVRQRWRSMLTLAVIVFGVAGLILAAGFVEDVYAQLAEATIHSQLGHLQIYRKGYYVQGSRKPFEYALPHPAQVADQVRKTVGVKDTMLRLNFSGLLSSGRANLAVVGEGVEPEPEARLGTYMRLLRGRTLTENDAFGILVGEGVAKSLRLSPGSAVTLLASTADGALNTVDFEVVGITRSFSKDYDDRAVRVPLRAAQRLVASDTANAIVVVLDATSRTAEMREELEDRLRSNDVEIKSWLDLSDFYEKTIALYQRQFGVLELITMIMVALSVMNSVSMTTFERVGEFGTMRALGDRSGMVFRLVVLESAITGLAGGLLGIAAGLALALVLSQVGIPMPPPPNAESGYTAQIRVIPVNLLWAFALGLCATVLGAMWPARRAARIPVVDALRENV